MMPVQELEGVQDQPECIGKTLSANGGKTARWAKVLAAKLGALCWSTRTRLKEENRLPQWSSGLLMARSSEIQQRGRTPPRGAVVGGSPGPYLCIQYHSSPRTC